MTCEHCIEIYLAIENFMVSAWRLYYTDGCAGVTDNFGLTDKFPQLACPKCHQDLTFTDGPIWDDEAEQNRVQDLGYQEAKKRGATRDV